MASKENNGFLTSGESFSCFMILVALSAGFCLILGAFAAYLLNAWLGR